MKAFDCCYQLLQSDVMPPRWCWRQTGMLSEIRRLAPSKPSIWEVWCQTEEGCSNRWMFSWVVILLSCDKGSKSDVSDQFEYRRNKSVYQRKGFHSSIFLWMSIQNLLCSTPVNSAIHMNANWLSHLNGQECQITISLQHWAYRTYGCLFQLSSMHTFSQHPSQICCSVLYIQSSHVQVY